MRIYVLIAGFADLKRDEGEVELVYGAACNVYAGGGSFELVEDGGVVATVALYERNFAVGLLRRSG